MMCHEIDNTCRALLKISSWEDLDAFGPVHNGYSTRHSGSCALETPKTSKQFVCSIDMGMTKNIAF